MTSSPPMRVIVMLLACATVPGTVRMHQRSDAVHTAGAGRCVGRTKPMPTGWRPGQPCGAPLPSAQGSHPIRQLFANTIAVIVQGVTTGLAGGVVQGISGSITGWFDRKQPGGSQASTYGAAAYPQVGGVYGQPTGAYPQTGDNGFPAGAHRLSHRRPRLSAARRRLPAARYYLSPGSFSVPLRRQQPIPRVR